MGARILVVDDHEIVREGVRRLLQEVRPEWEICGEATNGADAIAAVKELKPDVVILDLSMPRMSGLEAASRIGKLGLRCRLLMFSMHESERLGAEARQAGARGYVMKSQAAHHLIMAIDCLLAGGTFFGHPETEGEPDHDKPPASGLVFFRDFGFSWI